MGGRPELTGTSVLRSATDHPQLPHITSLTDRERESASGKGGTEREIEGDALVETCSVMSAVKRDTRVLLSGLFWSRQLEINRV